MEPLDFADLPDQALLLLDSAPIIYVLEAHPEFAPRFEPLFAAHAAGRSALRRDNDHDYRSVDRPLTVDR